MKPSILNLFTLLSISLCGTAALADVMCNNSNGYMVYAYPGAKPDGSRIPVAEFDGPNSLYEFMSCNQDYTSCSGNSYRFTRTNYGATVSGPGVLESLRCD